MSYIIVVQPVILKDVFPAEQQAAAFGAVLVATCLASAIGTLLMAFLANYPIAMAPAMGHNVFFVMVVTRLGIPWPYALGAVAVSGTIFTLVSFVDLRERIMRAVPAGLRAAIAAGIGLLIALVGFEWAKIVVPSPATCVTLGSLHDPVALLAVGGLAVTIVLMALNVRGAILLGILFTAVAGALSGVTPFPADAWRIVGTPPSLDLTFLKLRLPGMDWAMWRTLLMAIFVFFFLDLFDAIGTLIGVAQRGGFLKDGRLPRAKQALLSDALATVAGALLGTSTVSSYVESSAGVTAGGRTGLANVVTAALFVLAIFAYPFLQFVGQNPSVVAPALILVGALMMAPLRDVLWDDLTEAIPAFLTLAVMAFTMSITDGISFGFISYALVKLVTGRGRETSAIVYIFGALFVVYYVFHPLM
jgi:AGZA family xanthine/uracil permease-like MFS transporter